ncbi:AAA family ATPase [Citrobacter sp. R56]|uniref:AAA family ATPase n=1 Tax=Citrobacter sp. R56 TaxID=1573676 RepID=UPI00193AEB2E|nr:AAA family ATPase [Citrobacter sp. R56]QRG80919.1 AAA family ATPase [Citrobacter sp. R56]
MLNGIGIQNLRSFSQYAHSELKPLTVYLGRNSSGKSSLIRLFPLLRQSVEETTTGPILWYGRYVDYGNFNEAIHKSSESEEIIKLQFDLTLDTTPHNVWYKLNDPNRFPQLDFRLKIHLSEQNQKTYAKSISFEIDGSTIEVVPDFENESTTIHARGLVSGCFLKTEATSKKDYKFLPILSWITDTGKKSSIKEIPEVNKSLRAEYTAYMSRNLFREKENAHNKIICRFAAKQLKKFFHHNTKPETISDELFDVRAYSKDRLEHGVLSLFKGHNYFTKQMQNPEIRQEFLDILHPLILLKNYNSIADLINSSLTRSLLSVKYLAPIRANTERFYRFQDLQVEEMDHTGSNLAMILNSFSESETAKFQKWTNENFGFVSFVTTDGSHYAIKIKTENDNEEHNISDMGYGYSQVLPIIMSIWLEIMSEDNRSDEVIFVIEQPELHLHPAYQSKVAYLFAKVINAAKESDKNVKFIFETHSQSMIDAIGNCIQDKIIDKEDVNIMIFEKCKEKGSTAFTANFDDEGYFTNWPVGFFSGE